MNNLYEQFLDEWSEHWFQFIKDNRHKGWNYRLLSSNLNITWTTIKNNPKTPWDDSMLCLNPNITSKIAQANPEKFRDYSRFRIKSNMWIIQENDITREFIRNNPDEHSNYYLLSSNPNITWEIVQANPDKPWNYNEMCYNPNITWEIVQANPDKPWKYDRLSSNKMEFAREKFIRKKFQEWFKRSELKEELIATLWHPKNYEKFKYYDPEMFEEE